MGLENINRFEDWNLAYLTKFKKTPEQYVAWLKIKHAFRPILSWYKGCDSQIYNFQPECVSSKLDADGKLIELVKLCPVCSNCAANPEQGFPRYSIANGVRPVRQVRPERIFDWLEVLQAVHPSYANIIIDDSPSAVNQLTSVTDKLILHPEVLSSAMEINIDKVATERPANQPVTEDEVNEAVPSDTETSVNTSESAIPSISQLLAQDFGETDPTQLAQEVT